MFQKMITPTNGGGESGDGTAHGVLEQTTAGQEIEIDTGLSQITHFVIVGESLNLGYDKVTITEYSSATPTKYYWMNGGIYGGTGGQVDFTASPSATTTYYVLKSINGGKVTILVPTSTSPHYDNLTPYWFAM